MVFKSIQQYIFLFKVDQVSLRLTYQIRNMDWLKFSGLHRDNEHIVKRSERDDLQA
jgi:hypothetical protein